MFEIQCLDSHGKTIDCFTQWDVNQKIIIPVGGYNIVTSPDHNLPEVHFCNIKSDRALVVRSKSTDDDDKIIVDVPNILLQEPYPLMVYVYALDDINNPKSEKTVLQNEIPIRKRVKPSDYTYIENITNETAEGIRQTLWKSLEEDVDKLKSDVYTSLSENKDYVDTEVGNANRRMQQIEELFVDTTEKVEQAVIDINNATENIAYMEDFIAQAEIDKNVYYVEDQTLHAENIDVAQNITVGNFIWVAGIDGNMSLKWIGGGA